MSTLKVIIIGAGLGGLTLAQTLRRNGLAVEIFERDKSPFDRPQGYRLHLDVDAIQAAKEALSSELHAAFVATSQWTEPSTTILNQDLSVAKRLPTHDDHGADVWLDKGIQDIHANVDRATLRQILSAGLDDVTRFGKSFDRYENDKDGVTAFFSDGTTARGDLLVGADGIRSAVRHQRAPHAETVDAGITAIYGRIPIEAAVKLVPSETLEDIFTIAMDERKVFLGLSSVRFPIAPERASALLAPGLTLQALPDYVVCIIGGKHQFFPNDLQGASCERLQEVAVQTLNAWHEHAASVVSAGNTETFFLVEMYTSVPCELQTPTNVTLLGDAIHAMTPTLGRGANVAMRDGALLGRQLKKVAAGEMLLAEALRVYESGMLEYGFDVVRQAAKTGQQRMGQNPLPILSS
ncbi:FAD-dependent oxidoreductase [Pseudomonas syringae]|uniref:FAD-dependent oxidoreductase n=1 Tax=Pseudomonas syringae TaxID=317 RepID=UPI00028CB075|nr:FAD-dependent monooxygenase [Pseudomonas syringae]EKG35770.1 monooxygenase, FAD-binding protein [Pseudomonas syringae pv. avellanae str. ISPaVe037]